MVVVVVVVVVGGVVVGLLAPQPRALRDEPLRLQRQRLAPRQVRGAVRAPRGRYGRRRAVRGAARAQVLGLGARLGASTRGGPL